MKYDTSHIKNLPKGLDPEIVKQTHQGKDWESQDQARYDAAIAKRGEAKERAGNYKPAVESDDTGKSNTVYAGGTPGYYDKGGPGRSGKGVEQFQASQNVNQQNDIRSNVTGDDNYVYNNQDNSIRNYGGDNRSFVYNSNGEGPDTPATMATLAGYYAPDDSPGARASRLDQNVTMNRDNQKKYANTSHIAQGAIKRAEQNSFIDPGKLDQRIHKRSQYHRDQATIKGAEIFGDIYGLEAPTWNSADVAKPVEKPDFEEMYDKYTDF
jgi:hypothetical protein